MSTKTIRTKMRHRNAGGSAGAPSSALTAELNYNMQDGYLYVGYGDDGSGNATSIKVIGKDDFSTATRVPAGGSSGQVLTKSSGTDYALAWGPAGATYTASAGLTLTSGAFAVDYTAVAALASPALTGNPTVPTQAANDNTTKVASTAFVQGALASSLSLSVAGASNVTLTPAQALNGAFNFTGALTGNITVYFPAALKGAFIVSNRTTGAYSLTIAATGGSGIAISQNQNQDLFCDGTNVAISQTDFNSIALTGTPTAPTPSSSDNSTKVATTAMVQSVVTNYAGTAASTYAPLTSPVFTGTPSAPTPTSTDNTGKLATTAFVATAVANYASTAASTYAPLASPALTGNPTAPTQTAGDNSTKIATTAFVGTALGSYSTSSSIASTYAPLASPALTGTPTAPTQSAGDNSTKLATTSYVATAVTNGVSGLATLASPTFTGTPSAPTASAGTNTTQLATTAYVQAAVAAMAQGLSPKGSVKAAANYNISALSGTMTVDGVSLVAGDRVLLLGQSSGSQNGIYVIAAGAWSRSSDMTSWSQVAGSNGNAFVFANQGSTLGGHGFIVTNDPDSAGTIGTTSMVWTEFTGATDITAGAGIIKSGNQLSVYYGSGLTTSGSQVIVDTSVIAALASPTFTGTPAGPTAATATSTTQFATTAFVQQELTNLIIDSGTF